MFNRRRIRVAAVFAGMALAWLTTAGATTQPRTVYAGTLGSQPIVLELTPGDEADSAGRYFYVRHHRDLMLDGQLDAKKSLTLSEGMDDDAPRPQITLNQQADGGWRGTWPARRARPCPSSCNQPRRHRRPLTLCPISSSYTDTIPTNTCASAV